MSIPTLLPARKMAAYLKQQNPNSMITESFLRKLVYDGEIGTVKAGTRLLISAEEVEKYLYRKLAE